MLRLFRRARVPITSPRCRVETGGLQRSSDGRAGSAIMRLDLRPSIARARRSTSGPRICACDQCRAADAEDPRLPRAARGADRPHRPPRARPGPDRRSRPPTPSRWSGSPHRTGPDRDVELQVDDHIVIVSYGGEPLHLPRPGVRAPVRGGAARRPRRHRGAPRRALAHDQQLPRRLAPPVPRHPHAGPEPVARAPSAAASASAHLTLGRVGRAVGAVAIATPEPAACAEAQTDAAFTSGLIFTPGPIVDDVVMPFRYLPFADGGFARWISSSTAP